jgi:Dyp-type peroxidase family
MIQVDALLGNQSLEDFLDNQGLIRTLQKNGNGVSEDVQFLIAPRKSGNKSPESADARNMLDDLQGNILTWHKREKAHYFFFRFRENTIDTAKYLISMLATGVKRANDLQHNREAILQKISGVKLNRELPGKEIKSSAHSEPSLLPILLPEKDYNALKDLGITSELSLRSDMLSRKMKSGQGNPPVRPTGFFTNLLLTAGGYRILNVQAEHRPTDEAFDKGMKDRAKEMNDPPLHAWEAGYNQEIHGLFILAYNPENSGESQRNTADTFRKVLNTYAQVVHEEKGIALKQNGADPAGSEKYMEVFGYRDGISQPLFYESDVEEKDGPNPAPAAENHQKNWDPGAPLKLVLVKDPGGRHPYSCGTYFAFRKLQQHVDRFKKAVADLAEVSGQSRRDVLGRLVGRYTDGTPVGSPDVPAGFNDFDYRTDRQGSACPFHAHIRKVNPRSDAQSPYGQVDHRIVRRGLAYGEGIEKLVRDKDMLPVNNPQGEVGLLFMCAQANLAAGFEHVQKNWAGNPEFAPHRMPGSDPFVGSGSEEESRINFRGEKEPGSKDMMAFRSFSRFVELKGGEYFFAPSISFLKGLFDF